MLHAIYLAILRALDLRYARTSPVDPKVGGIYWGEEARTRWNTAYYVVCKGKQLVLRSGFYQGRLVMKARNLKDIAILGRVQTYLPEACLGCCLGHT